MRAAAIILTISALGASIHAWIRPLSLDIRPPSNGEETFLSLERAREMFQRGDTVFLDARSPREFAKGCIAGASNLTLESFDEGFPEVLTTISFEHTPVVLYCEAERGCGASKMVAKRLEELGFRQVHILRDGFRGWQGAGLPVEVPHQ